jgi:hypothetical protein
VLQRQWRRRRRTISTIVSSAGGARPCNRVRSYPYPIDAHRSMLECLMISHWQNLLCGALLLGIASQNRLVGQESPLLPPVSTPVQVYLTASNKDNSPAILDQSELRVFVDIHPAQVISLRSASEDKLLFAILVDTSTSTKKEADSIKEAAIRLFQSLAAGGNQGYLVVFDTEVRMSGRPFSPQKCGRLLVASSLVEVRHFLTRLQRPVRKS